MKVDLSLWVRMPDWVDRDQVVCDLEGKNRRLNLTSNGRYLSPVKINRGQTVTFRFPISVKEVKTRIEDMDYTLTIKGNTVVQIDPPGRVYPLYQRSRYLKNKAPMKDVTRFVAEEVVD
jgi:hypothetical protein